MSEDNKLKQKAAEMLSNQPDLAKLLLAPHVFVNGNLVPVDLHTLISWGLKPKAGSSWLKGAS